MSNQGIIGKAENSSMEGQTVYGGPWRGRQRVGDQKHVCVAGRKCEVAEGRGEAGGVRIRLRGA